MYNQNNNIMKNKFKELLETNCKLVWWNCGSKTPSYDGDLKGLLHNQDISYTKRKTDTEGIFKFYFKSIHGITYTKTGIIEDFVRLAKQAIQMEMVRMGDKAELTVRNCHRPTVSVNK